MQRSYEKLIRREVTRRVSVDHPYFEDLCQEARIALFLIESKIDKTLSIERQRSYLRQAIRWHITKCWHIWLRESLLVSVKSLREKRAALDKRKYDESYLLEAVSMQRSPEEAAAESFQLEKVIAAFEEAIKDNRDALAFKGFLEDVDTRTLGKRMNMSHQGALNVQKRLLERVKTILRKNDKKTDCD